MAFPQRDQTPDTPAMTAQQRAFAEPKQGALRAYKQVMVGERGWLAFACFELYRLFLAPMESILGIGLRRLVLPRFLRGCGKGLVAGHGVTIRQPGRISLGKKVIIDDYALVDVRSREDDLDRPGDPESARVDIGDYVYIGRQSIVSAKYGRLRLGNGVNIGSATRLATRETLEIGDSVLISSYVYIGGGNHGSDRLDVPIMEQEMESRGGVSIGANTWIGTKATIVDGVTIGRDVIIGAHSLVRDNVPDRAVVAGVPAKVIRFRE